MVPEACSPDVKRQFAELAGAAMARGLDREIRERCERVERFLHSLYDELEAGMSLEGRRFRDAMLRDLERNDPA